MYVKTCNGLIVHLCCFVLNDELKQYCLELISMHWMCSAVQGETVDRIEDQISAAADHVGRGAKTVRETVSIAHRGRKVR